MLRSLSRTPALLGVLGACVALIAACGGDGDSGDDRPAAPPPTARAESFPKASGQSFPELLGNVPEGPVLAPAVSVLDPGRNRLAFALFDRAKNQLTGAEVVIYTASEKGTGMRGPYPARSESLAVRPQFVARSTAADTGSAKSYYVADVPFRKKGFQAVIALARLDGRLVRSSPAGVNVGGVTSDDEQGTDATSTFTGSSARPPEVGDRAPRISTPTTADVGGNLEEIDTRVPPSTMHETDYADVLGKRPIVLVFATPKLCQSRVCGPTVDVAEQVKAKYGSRAEFIHMEIFEGNRITNPPKLREQVEAFQLPSEPWVFVIDRNGRIAARLEGPISVGELERAVAQGL